MADQPTQLSRWQIWMLAARPKTLPAAASPVVIGSAVAYWDGYFRLGPALATLLAALLLQIGANLANDVFDFHRGADTAERLGPTRVTQAGLLAPRQVTMGMWVCFGLAALLGVYLTLVSGWPVVLIGLASIAAAIAYTGGPFPLGYYGLGDLTVFIFFGLAAVCGTYYIQALKFSWLALWSSLPMGFLITAILVVNNLRDIDTDRAAGKHTLAVRLGVKGTRWEYLLLVAWAFVVPPIIWLSGLAPAWVLLAWLSIPLGVSLVRDVWTKKGRPLNKALGGTGQLALLFSLLFSLGLVIGFFRLP
ncbi:MAG: 1,4-dihydroxy-2-naphthoate polyprenyltransferase [Chloroflexi bacterium]|nr:1,4-dihydroxy-2-naphthoate polyprenyltransferase [Chloroflexota bacterium]